MIRIALLALTLGGCAMTAKPAASDCRADGVQSSVGQRYMATLGTRLQRTATARTVRVIRPGMAVTMDYRTDRLNVTVDDKDLITALRCG